MSHLRIEQDGRVAVGTKVIHVADDGTETDISACLSRVDINLKAGEPVTATLTGFVGKADVDNLDADHVLADLTPVLPPELRAGRVSPDGDIPATSPNRDTAVEATS